MVLGGRYRTGLYLLGGRGGGGFATICVISPLPPDLSREEVTPVLGSEFRRTQVSRGLLLIGALLPQTQFLSSKN
jgi:hypothetical protein